MRTNRLILLVFSLVAGLLVAGWVTYEAFDLAGDFSLGTITDATDWQGIIFVNLLVGVSVLLLILELRWDTLRVLLTVVVALIFGYIMTVFFNLDAADRFERGEFRVRIISDSGSPFDLSYEESLTGEFNNPDAPLEQTGYSFYGGEGNLITLLAYALDADTGLDMQVALLGPDGEELITANEASRRFTRQYGDYIQSESDAVIKDFELPVDGTYTIVAAPEGDSVGLQAEFGVTLLSDDKPPVGLAYNGDPIGAILNREDADDPLTEATYGFIGNAGDTVTVLAFAFRASGDLDVVLELEDPSGAVIDKNEDATDEQVAAFPDDLKSTKDAILQDIVLPEDGTYTVRIRPTPVDSNTRISETFKATNDAYEAFLLGPLSRLNRWVIWVRDAITLIMLGLAIALVFRAEQFSLGAEGQLYFGALVSASIGLAFGDLPKSILVPVALLSAATAGFLWGLLPGALKAYLGANELVSTLMLNTIAQRFYEMVLTFQLQPDDAGYTSSDWISSNGLLTPIIDLDGDTVTIAVFIAIALVLFTWVLLQRTPIGYEIRMIGANIKFADYGGVNTKRTIMLTMAISGILAGLAGAHLSMGIHRKLILNISVGLAFEGVVVALLARNNPLVVPFTGFLYAYLRTGAQVMERDADISAEVVRIIQAVVILLITAESLLTFFRQRRVRRQGSTGGDEQALPQQAEGSA